MQRSEPARGRRYRPGSRRRRRSPVDEFVGQDFLIVRSKVLDALYAGITITRLPSIIGLTLPVTSQRLLVSGLS